MNRTFVQTFSQSLMVKISKLKSFSAHQKEDFMQFHLYLEPELIFQKKFNTDTY